MSTMPNPPDVQQPSLDLLMKLVQQQPGKAQALQKLAEEQVTNQPVFEGKPQNFADAIGRITGSTADNGQRRAMQQMVQASHNRDRRLPGGGLVEAAGGFEKGQQLMDSIREKEKMNRVAGSKIDLEQSQQQISNIADLYKMGQQDRDLATQRLKAETAARTAGKPVQVSYGGKVWNHYPDGTREMLGNTEGTEGRNAEQAETRRKEQEEKDLEYQAALNTNKELSGHVSKIDTQLEELYAATDATTVGPASLSAIAPGTPARDYRSKLESVKSNLALDQLQELRRLSADGSSGLGQLTKNEFDALMAAVDTLDQGASPTRMKEALENIRKYYSKALVDYGNIVQQKAARAGKGGYSSSAQKWVDMANGS